MKNTEAEPLVRTLGELLPPERALVVDSCSKAEALELLIKQLSGIAPEALLREKILAREKLMSTGIGLALAIPHARLNEAKSAGVAAVLVRSGIPDYESLDSKPVRLVVMIVTSAGQHTQHLKLLSQISARLKAGSAAIFAAGSAAELHRQLIR